MKEKQAGITLIALVITIVILLILAGISISALGGENGILARANEAKKAQIEAEMEETLYLAIQDLQIEKQGGATLDDITEEWLKGKMPEDYEIIAIEDDPTTGGKKVVLKKDGVTGTFIIDKDLNITKIENEDRSVIFTYTTGERVENKVKITIKVQAEKGINKIEIQDKEKIEDKTEINENGTKEEITIEDYEVEIGKEYNVTITLANGEKKEKTILINEYYYKITKELGEGISITNSEVKAAYNQPYKAEIKTEGDYVIDTLTVTMGGEAVTIVDGVINIEKVTGDIEIKATVKKLEIQYTAVAVSLSSSSSNTSSDNANSIEKGNTIYINILANLNGVACTVTNKVDRKVVPYAVTENGKYTFIVEGTYNGKTISEEKEVTVDQYIAAKNLVKYSAGDWTETEIQSLKTAGLYNLNANAEQNSTKGLNFTFGGFTNKESSDASTVNIITSKDKSVKASYGGTTHIPKYDGWQILESIEENGKIYVTKIVHAGCPENFVYYYTSTSNDGYRAEYILSGGKRQTKFNTYSARNWQMYIDESQKDLIANDETDSSKKDIHIMTYDEAYAMAGDTSRTNGSHYWIASAYSANRLWRVNTIGEITNGCYYCFGIRPVVSLVSGVYIASGSGTEADPYILGKD